MKKKQYDICPDLGGTTGHSKLILAREDETANPFLQWRGNS
jgi:hypothetical protein